MPKVPVKAWSNATKLCTFAWVLSSAFSRFAFSLCAPKKVFNLSFHRSATDWVSPPCSVCSCNAHSRRTWNSQNGMAPGYARKNVIVRKDDSDFHINILSHKMEILSFRNTKNDDRVEDSRPPKSSDIQKWTF